jgi:SNF2 family DNA or RNA helicase
MISSREKNYKCLYCTYSDTDLDIVKAHEEYLHGCFRDINPRSIKKEPKKTKPFNPEEVYRNLTLDDNDTIIEGKLECVHFDKDGRKIPLNRQLDIWYIYDSNQKRYRMYTDETKYGDYKEIVYSKKTGTFTIKGIDTLRREWDKAHGIVKEDVVSDMLNL